jgi:hypothetical protein
MKLATITIALLLTGNVLAQDNPPPLSRNCQAKLELTEEVTRLLTKAASHATQSSACIDGPGQRAVVDQVLVCPARKDKKEVTVDAEYQVTRWAEGDTRMCGQTKLRPRPKLPGEDGEAAVKNHLPDLCSGTPAISKHRMRFRFLRKGKALEIEIPKAILGLEEMTPLNKVHKGGCYGESGPFKPARIKL